LKDLTIAARINILFLGAALLLAGLATWYTAYREYHIALDQTRKASAATVLSRPDLQVKIYRRDQPGLEQALGDFFESPAVSLAIARDGLGEVLAQRHRAAEPATRSLSFSQLRPELSAVETGLVALDRDGDTIGTGLWSALAGSDLPMHLSMPVFTSANAGQKGLKAIDFVEALGSPEANDSLRVIGYVQLGIERADLLQAIGPAVSRVFYGSLLFLVLSGLVVWLMSRRITRNLAQLARLADDVASGNLHKPVEIDASGELKEIANVLNGVIGGFSSFKQEVNVDQRLLNMKVNERTTQLSLRDEALNKATEEISETRTRLQRLAYYDSLTSLPNRRLFTEQLSLLLGQNQRAGHTLALLFIDLDNFKRINDSLGQSAGDLTLLEVGRRLANCVRNSDPVAHDAQSEQKIDVSRLGGDEFTVILNQLDSIESAALVAQRLVDVLLEPIVIEGQELVITPSIGIAVAPRDGEDVEALLKAAGIAMHHAKASVRDKFLFFKAGMDAASGGRLKLEADLRKAVERNQLVVHYQPQVNTLTGSVAGAEALLRWDHPEHGLVPPYQFVPLAEEIGVIAALGDWVLTETCRQLQAFDAQGLNLPRVAINVSALEFSPAFVSRVKDVLQQFELPGSRLELGLTESILTDGEASNVQSLEELRELGIYLSVDDFGIGHSPLGYLSRYTLDALRLDRSFVLDCDSNEDRARLVVAIIAMAKSLNLGLVAEGVETEEQFRFLADSGVHVFQGYLLSKPEPAALLAPMLAPWHFVEQVQKM
jgi:diguanylate cyclase (GGDEF)-like protein